jgi:hypothetical protein
MCPRREPGAWCNFDGKSLIGAVVMKFCLTQLELAGGGARSLLHDRGADTEVLRTEVGDTNSALPCSTELP